MFPRLIKTRKAQAILPFFALNLAALLIFFVVVLSLLAMSKNLKFTVDEFNSQSLAIISKQRMIATADCFAAEDRAMAFDNSGNFFSGSNVQPGMLDVNKLNDIDYFNCMRKDKYDISPFQYTSQGIWDASTGSGASFRYAVAVYDLITNQYVYYPPVGSSVDPGFKKHEINSLLTRISKHELKNSEASTVASDCSSRFNDNWDDIQHCSAEQCDRDSPVSLTCKENRCEYQTSTFQTDGTEIKPYWVTNTIARTVFDAETIDPSDNYLTKTFIQEEKDPLHDKLEEYTISCDSQETLQRTVSPVLLKSGTDVHPGMLIFSTCVIKGEKYDGVTVLENLQISSMRGDECK